MGVTRVEHEGSKESHTSPETGRRDPPAPRPALQLGNRIAAHAIAARGVQGPGGPLPYAARLSAAFGPSALRGVRAHFGAAAGDSAARLGARAYAFGEDIAFREATPSLRTVAHELAHVVQQRAGVAVPQGLGRAGDVHERHADAVADRVVAGGSAEALLAALPSAGPPGPALQLSEVELSESQRAARDPYTYLATTARSDWNEVRAAYKEHRLLYDRALGPTKEGAFDLKAAQDAGAGMNVLLALRLRETLLKREHQPNLQWFGDLGPSLLQGIHDTLKQEHTDPDFSWSYEFAWNYGAGTESPTSDIDCNLSGAGTEEVVRRFNAEFRTKWGRESGSVFDVNVYARDFLPAQGSAPLANKRFLAGPRSLQDPHSFGFEGFRAESGALEALVRFEVPLDANSAGYGQAMDSERVYALVKTCMDMSPADWKDFKAESLAAAQRIDQQDAQPSKQRQEAKRALFEQVEGIVKARANAIEARIHEIREAKRQQGHKDPATLAEARLEDADLDMRAQNELYAEGLMKVASLRSALATAGGDQLGSTGAELTDALHAALIFANESYVTGAAVQHVVLDKQMLSSRQKDPLKLTDASKAPKTAHNMKLALTAERYLHSAHEQLGFAFREFNLYERDAETALGKASKYIYRLGNAAKHVAALNQRPIEGLEAFRDFGKRLLALKTTPDLASAAGVTLTAALECIGLAPGTEKLLARVKERLIAFAAAVDATFG